MKKLLIGLVILAAIMIAGFVWWHGRNQRKSDDLILYGNVDIRQISLAFDGSGRVTEMHVQEGDPVKAGTLLAKIDTDALELQAKQAEAQLEVQRQSLTRLKNGSRPEEVAAARSRLAAAQADAAQAAQDLARLQEISDSTKSRGVSAQDLERAKSKNQVALTKVTELNQALQLTELGPRAEDIAAAEAQLKGSQAQLELLQLQIAKGSLKSPTEAVVRSRLLEPGDMATPQRPVFGLALTHPKWVRVYVSETDLGKVSPGKAAMITTDTQPDQPIEGKVSYISSVAEFTPKNVQTEELRTSLVYEVRILTEDERNQLRLGQPVTVQIKFGEAR